MRSPWRCALTLLAHASRVYVRHYCGSLVFDSTRRSRLNVVARLPQLLSMMRVRAFIQVTGALTIVSLLRIFDGSAGFWLWVFRVFTRARCPFYRCSSCTLPVVSKCVHRACLLALGALRLEDLATRLV